MAGRIDKREAILSAAFTVFARDGYAQASVADIAAEAGVAKPTVYNHLTDKATLFRHAVAAEADRQLAANLAVLDDLDGHADLARTLTEVGRRLLEQYRTDRARALRRLIAAEVPHFPELLDAIPDAGGGRLHQALADRLARLVLAGELRNGCVLKAADQFLALLTGPLDRRSALGTRPVPDPELCAVTQAAVQTFLLAHGAEPVTP